MGAWTPHSNYASSRQRLIAAVTPHSNAIYIVMTADLISECSLFDVTPDEAVGCPNVWGPLLVRPFGTVDQGVHWIV
jgi:hypothetical protein